MSTAPPAPVVSADIGPRAVGSGKYGRYIATVERKADGEILNDALLKTFDDIDS